jgi:uncharacterized protein YxeA
MNKILLIVVAVALIGGIFYFSKNRQSQQSSTFQQQSQTETQTKNQKEQKTNVFTSIKDALTRGQSLKCQFTDESGKKTTVYFKKDFVRGMYNDEKEVMNNFLYRDKKMYTWGDQTKEGMIIATDSISAAPTTKQTNKNEQTSTQDYIMQYEKYWQNCKTETVSDVLFTLPSDVKFQNVADMMQQMMKR